MTQIVHAFRDVLLNITLTQKTPEFAGTLKTKCESFLKKGDIIPVPTEVSVNDPKIWLNYIWLIKMMRNMTYDNDDTFNVVHDDKLSFFEHYKVCTDETSVAGAKVIMKGLIYAIGSAKKDNLAMLTSSHAKSLGTPKYREYSFHPVWESIISSLQDSDTLSEFLAVHSLEVAPIKNTVAFNFKKQKKKKNPNPFGDEESDASKPDSDDDDMDDLIEKLDLVRNPSHDPVSHARIVEVMLRNDVSAEQARQSVIADIITEYFKDPAHVKTFLGYYREEKVEPVIPPDTAVLHEILGGIKSIMETLEQQQRILITPGPSVLSENPKDGTQDNVLVQALANKITLPQQAPEPVKVPTINWDLQK